MIERLDHLSLSHSFQPGGEQDEERKQNSSFFFSLKKTKLLTREGKTVLGARRAKGCPTVK